MATKKPTKTVDPKMPAPRGPAPKEVVEKVTDRNGLTKVADKQPKK